MSEQVTPSRRGREGGRWINERPSSDEFAQWFRENMKIDSALAVEDYVGGVVLIPAVDSKAPYVTGFKNGVPVIERREELIFTPYPKVDTRIDYFWDLLAIHEEWVGVVENLTPPRLSVEPAVVEESITEAGGIERKYARPGGLATMVHQLPGGFSVMSVPVGQGYSHFLLCTKRVAIYRADEDGLPKGSPLRMGEGSKQVPLTKSGYQSDRVWADDSSLMKAETGALGRALGFAGIFVIPGSGVATAEDMIEAMSQGETPAEQTPQAPQTPEPVRTPRTGAEQAEDDEGELRKRALALYNALQKDHPDKGEEFTQWVRGRKLGSLSAARGAALRGVVKTLERLTEEAQKQGAPGAVAAGPEDAPQGEAGEPTEEASDVSAEKAKESANGE